MATAKCGQCGQKLRPLVLNDRDVRALSMLAGGYATADIQSDLAISASGYKRLTRKVRALLGASTLTQATVEAIKRKIIPMPEDD